MGDRNGMIGKERRAFRSERQGSGCLLPLSALHVRVRRSKERQSEEDRTLRKQTEGLERGGLSREA